MSTYPSEQQCIDLLKAYGVTERIIKHVCTVTVLAVTIAERCGADVPLVQAGAMLHDIGRTRTHGIRHGVEGEDMARAMSLPEPVVQIIRRHVGAGILPEEAAVMGLPDRDYVPVTLEEKIVCHSDNLVSDDRYIESQESYRDFVSKDLENSGRRMLAMHKELSNLCGSDVDEVVREVRMKRHSGPCSEYLKMEIKRWTDGPP